MARKRQDTLTQAIDTYLTYRRAGGFDLVEDGLRLHSFGRFAEARGDRWVRSATAVEWAALGPSPRTRRCRLGAVIRFARCARVEVRQHEVPSGEHFSGKYCRRPPRLFSQPEIRLLLRGAAGLEPADSLRPETFVTLFGLLAVTGMRVSEALALRVADLRRDERLLVVRQTKCRKSRLVPIHPSTLAAIDRYLRIRRRVDAADDRIFILNSGKPLFYWVVKQMFHKILRSTSLFQAPPRRPRIHDLRHTFAVRALEACPGEGRDHIGRHVRAISLYLGHVNPVQTYWYFQVTPRLMKDMADAARATVEGDRP